MKKAVAFLLAFLIFVSPMTTFVKADVVIGDNDNLIVNENATILGRKLAMLESLSELALSGVTEYTISNTDDVDTYLDSLWSEINSAIDYLDSGEWVNDIPNNIASKYYTNLVKYRDIVNNRGEFLGFDLQNPTTSLLKTYFANDIYGKKYTSNNLYSTLDMVRSLSALTRGQSVNPNVNYIPYITTINDRTPQVTPYGTSFFWNNNMYFNNTWTYYKNNVQFTPTNTYPQLFSWIVENVLQAQISTYSDGIYSTPPIIGYDIFDVYINNINGTYQLTTSSLNQSFYYDRPIYGHKNAFGLRYQPSNNNLTFQNTSDNKSGITSFTYSGTLDECFDYLARKVKNVNIYVDGVLWSKVSDENNSPILDIDGFLKLYGNNNTPQYELQSNTQIDYDQLYQVIYNAIRDNLPISQGDINYYDSHDTIYSPTIINNYGEDEGDESDLIDTILDYAVIPKFDTAIAQPMRQALTNGVVIMNKSITNVIPNEILLILGACFFLLLFAVVINRMIT